ncbi:MAG: hypothetical protein NWF02_07725 [Candidatus Bathyarchaeota archaeon]|nr:hypothetical protein [Candidatus Bathyarchaeum sp.]
MAENEDTPNKTSFSITKYKDCSISNKFLSIILIQVKPGTEEEVGKQLLSWKNDIIVCKGLGRYDLLVMREEEGPKEPKLVEEFTNFPHENILDINNFHGFRWVTSDRNSSECLQAFNKKKIIGVCCVKLKPEINKDHLIYELDSIKRIYEGTKNENTTTLIFGGMGWNEVISLICCDTIADLTSVVNAIRCSLHNSNQSLFVDTSTIPCINFYFIEKRKRLEQLDENVNVDILVGTKEPRNNIEKIFKNQFGNYKSAFGFHDYIVRCRNINLGKFIRKILDLRKQEGLLHTYTILIHKHPKITNESIDNPNFIAPFGDNAKQLSFKLSKIRGNEKTIVKLFMNSFSIIQNDPLTNDIFPRIDIIWERLVAKIIEIERYRREDVDEYHRALSLFHLNIDCLRTALIERSVDLPLTNLLGGKNLIETILVGTSRILKASESIPLYLLDVFGEKWEGICFHGYYNRFYRLYTGIINIPSTELIPMRFWSLYHESGHEVFNIFEESKKPWFKIINESVESHLEDWKISAVKHIREDPTIRESDKDNTLNWRFLLEESETWHFTQEIFAEMFSFRYGFFEDWELWKGIVWSYVTKEYFARIEFVARSVLLNLCLGPEKNHWPNQLQEKVDEIIDELESSTPATRDRKIKMSKDVRLRVFIIIQKYLPIAQEIAKLFSEISIENKPTPEQIEESFQSLNQGIPIKVVLGNRDITPIIVINSIIKNVLLSKKGRKTDIKRRTAAILSLYNYYAAKRSPK